MNWSLESSGKTLLLAITCLISSPALYAGGLEVQREEYRQAKAALKAGRLKKFRYLAGTLKEYPLYPYLLYDYLRPRLWKVKDKEVIGFLKRYGDLPMAEDIRRSWLKLLAERRRWQTFMENYTPQSDITLQCYHLQARIKTDNQAYFLEDTRTIWLAGRSQPQSELMTTGLVWQRIQLAMQEGNVSLAGYLGRRLSKKDRKWLTRWISMHHHPAKWTKKINYADEDIPRRILVHGMRRLTRVSIDQTIDRWQSLRERYSFTRGQKNAVEKTLAVKAAQKRHKRAIVLLDQLDKSIIDEKLFQWRLRTALQNYDWRMLLNWTTGTPPNEAIQTRWTYWQARALHELGDRQNAEDMFRKLARERDYYGFLAADRLGLEYDMNHHPLPEDLQGWQGVAEIPAIVRARELYLLGHTYPARREWHHALNDMTTYQMQLAAGIATNWGWHDRAILTLGRAKAYDDLISRFPLPYEKRIRQYSIKRELDLGWVYALVRAESAFIEEVRSPAGALGLMQVMPETGRLTASSIGYKRFDVNMLLDEKHSVAIGTAYLKQMYDKFNGNVVLATAAYNAGPGNVSRWLPEPDCLEPEIWIEKIPFDETRKYVRRIMYFASIYDWRLQREVVPVAERMNKIVPTRKQLIAKLDCTKKAVAYR